MNHKPRERYLKRLWKIVRGLLITAGSMAVVLIILAFTTAPFWTWYGMAVKKAGINRPPDYIILLGGGGMPSESGLIRSWYAAIAGGYFTRAKIIIALPGDAGDTLSSIAQMKKELILRGISPERIILEDSGTNTRSQALHIEQRIVDGEQLNNRTIEQANKRKVSLLIVTSPEHLFRAVLTFKKAGFLKVDGFPAFEQAIESDITFNAKKLGGRKFIPDVGENLTLRYQFWTQAKYELLILREWTALAYYKLMGWI